MNAMNRLTASIGFQSFRPLLALYQSIALPLILLGKFQTRSWDPLPEDTPTIDPARS